MTYKLTNSNYVIRLSDDTLIPDDPANVDYQTYLAWVEEGNVAQPYLKPTVIGGVTDLTDGKKYAVEAVRLQAHDLLVPTDWVVVREMETGVAASEEITTYRTAVRTASEEKVATIEASDSIEDLQTYLRSDEFAAWPTPPAN